MTTFPDGDDALDYKPVSPLAVAAAVAGICSALALVTRFAWGLPLLGFGMAVAALADLARPGTRKAGRLAALAGLAFSVGFGAQAVTAVLVDRWIQDGRARAAATAWIDAVREGRTAEALGISAGSVLPPSLSPPPPAGDEEDEAGRLARFLELPAVKAVAACGAASPAFRQASAVGTDDGAWMLTADLGPCGEATTLRLAVVPRRIRGTAGDVERWTVVSVGVDP